MLDSIKPPKKYNMLKKVKPSRGKTKLLILIFLVIILIIPVFYIFKTGWAFSKIITIKNISWEKIFGNKFPSSEYTPPKDEDRINAVLLGIRGEGDPNGGLLTDGIMVLSFQKSTGKIALISIPRDLYLQLPGEVRYEKINAAYAIGMKKYENGLNFTKKTIAYVTGLYIDYASIINFEALKDIIDLLGGITIYLDKPFIENKQWLCDENGQNCDPFVLGEGEQKLNGEIALLYARSRFSSNDFDRAKRQQQILLAIKDKLLSLGIVGDPLKISGIIDVLSKNVETDVSPWEIPKLIDLTKKAKIDNIIRRVFDNTEQGLLDDSTINGIYVLLPKEGNFSKIREACQKIFQ